MTFLFLRQRRKQNELLEETLSWLMWTSVLTCDLCQVLASWRKPAGKAPQRRHLNWWNPVEFPTFVNIHRMPWKCPRVLHFSSYYLSESILVWGWRWCSSDTSGCPLKFVGPPVSTFLALLNVLPLVAVSLRVPRPLSPLLSVPFPHLFAELIHRVQVGVVD